MSLLGIYWKEFKLTSKTTLFTIAKLWNQPRFVRADECFKKIWFIYIHKEVLFSHKEIMSFLDIGMELEIITLSKIS
jgi:hypothetical protein